MFKRILTGLYHFSWYAAAFIILTAAVLATVLRLSLPEIGNYKNEIQSWVSEYMAYPVVINEISADWKGWTPQLYLNNIDLYTPDNKTLITKFKSATLGVDLFRSLNQREVVPSRLVIVGLNLELTRNTDGSISIENNSNNNLNDDSNNSALSDWLLKQKHIRIEDASLVWHDKKASNEKLTFSKVELDLKTQKERIQSSIFIDLPEEHGKSLTVKMDAIGNILTPDWKGSVYIEAREIKPTQLLKNLPIKSINGMANVNLWSDWDKGKLIDFSGEISHHNFQLSNEKFSLPINKVNLNFHAQRKKQKDWLLQVNIDELQTANGTWPISNYQIDITKNDTENSYQYRGQLSFLKLEDIAPFLATTDLVPKSALNKINLASIKGELAGTQFNYDPRLDLNEALSFKTNFSSVSLTGHDKRNTLTGLGGSININNNHRNVIIKSRNALINLGSTFTAPFQLSALNTEFDIIQGESTELVIKEFQAEDKFISINSSGIIIFKENNSPFIDVVAHIGETDIENFPKYLPKDSAADLIDWLNESLLGGQLLSADFIYRGHVADYPFKNSEGVSKSILSIENVTLDYDKEWPPVDNITADIVIHNNRLHVDSNSASIFDATIDHFKAYIDPLDAEVQHLMLSGSVTGHTTDAGNFIIQSPLNEKASLRDLTENISGGFNLLLDFDIPLNDEDTEVEGIVSFTETTIESDLPGLGLEKVNGKASFSSDAVWATDIDALYHGVPVKLNIPKFDQTESDAESYIISGMANKDFFISELISFFPSVASISKSIDESYKGESKWSLTLKEFYSEKKEEIIEVEFKSGLEGIAINLPAPLIKQANTNKTLSVKTTLTNESIDNININYDNNIYADFKIDNSQDLVIENVLIGLGHQHPPGSTSTDISIKGELEELNISEWLDFLNPEKKSPSKNNNLENQKTINSDIHIKRFKMFDNEFNNINVSFGNPVDDWQLGFDSEDIKGQAKFIATDNNRLQANFEKLTLYSSDNEDDKNLSHKISINNIPPLEVNVENFIYDGNELGKLNIFTNNVNNGINFKNLSIEKPGFNIKATGEWLRIDDIDRSNFQAMLEADSIETMLSTLNFNSANIKNGATKIEMKASWVDTPMNFAMDKIEGVLDMNIEKGQFLDIDPSAGRLFGLLSLQTLPRRLTLDFSDLFGEGFAFDNIEGNFSIQQGHAYTNNLEMTGPSADIYVSGRTGLSTEDYDQIATVTPKISSGLPVASALFGPVGVGVGAVIYLAGEIFESIPKKIDDILKLQYTITGSWDNPNIEKIEKEKDSG